MAPQNGGGDELSYLCHLIATLLDSMESFKSYIKISFVLFIPLRNPRVQIPAVIIESWSRSDQGFNLRFGLFFQMNESHHNVGHLHTRVVDVVLDIDLMSGDTE